MIFIVLIIVVALIFAFIMRRELKKILKDMED